MKDQLSVPITPPKFIVQEDEISEISLGNVNLGDNFALGPELPVAGDIGFNIKVTGVQIFGLLTGGFFNSFGDVSVGSVLFPAETLEYRPPANFFNTD